MAGKSPSHRLPPSPGDIFGLTAASGAWIGLLFSLAVLGVLIWAFITAS